MENFPPSKTRDKIARQIGIGSGRQYDKAKKIWEAAKSGDPIAQEMVGALDAGNKTIHAALSLFSAP